MDDCTCLLFVFMSDEALHDAVIINITYIMAAVELVLLPLCIFLPVSSCRLDSDFLIKINSL